MESLMEVKARILVLQEEVKKLEKIERDSFEAKKATVKKNYQFMLTPLEKPFDDGFNRVMDPAIAAWHLSGKILNPDECLAVGHSKDDVGTKGMTYLFNTASGRFIMQTGGGHIFISVTPWSVNDPIKKREIVADAEAVFSLMADFVKDNPKGGDVTHIVKAQRHKSWA